MQFLKKILLRQTALASVLTGPAKLAIEQYRAVLRQEEKSDGDPALSSARRTFDPEEEKAPSVQDEAQRSATLFASLAAAMAVRRKTAEAKQQNAEISERLSVLPQTGASEQTMQVRESSSAWEASMADISRFFERDARRYGG